MATQTLTFTRRLERPALPEPTVLEPIEPEPANVTPDSIALLAIGTETEPAVLEQIEALSSVGKVSRLGILAGPTVSRRMRNALLQRNDVAFVLRTHLHSPLVEYRLRKLAGQDERFVLALTGEHFLPAHSIRSFMAFHEEGGGRETHFTPGPHASWRTLPIAYCWDIARFRERPLGALRRAVAFATVRRSLRRLPEPLKRRLRPLAAYRAALRARQHTPTGATALTAAHVAGAEPHAGPKLFLGTPRDQVELLSERAGEFYPFPSVVNLVLTNLCNLSCIMCPYHSPRYEDKSGFFHRAKYMTDEIFERVAREAGEHRATLKLGQLEEVLIHPRLIPWIERARELGVPDTHITTNGTLLTPEKSAALMKAGLTSIYVSLDAATPETYEVVRGWKGGLEEVWGHIDALIENRNRYAPETRIRTSFILQPEARHERDAFIEMWRERGIDGVIIYQLSEHYDEGKADFNGKYFQTTPPEQRHACSSVWQEAYVYPKGEVSMCCNTMILVPQHGLISMGNVLERPLQDIWLGAQYQSLRQRLLLNDIKGDIACQDCDIWHSSETRVEQRDGYRVEMNPVCAIYEFT